MRRKNQQLSASRMVNSPWGFCRVSGRPVLAEVEPAQNARNRDHVWITVDGPGPKNVRVAVNTFSNRNFEAGFDGRVRLGIVREEQTLLPEPHFGPDAGLDYNTMELSFNVFYEHFVKEDLERLLLKKVRKAVWIEAWGEAYLQARRGIHQIHSQAASCAVPEHRDNRDGALRLYFKSDDDGLYSEMLLFKFCGQ